MPKIFRPHGKNWCFTLNNPSSNIIIPELPMEASYLIYQIEEGDNKTPHAQGYIEFSKRMYFNRIKLLLPQGCHIEIARGTPIQNKAYCTKEPRIAGPFEFGTMSKGHGNRKDLEELAEQVLKKGSLLNVNPVDIIKHGKGLQLLASTVQPPYRPNLKVITLIGYTGLGKTFAIKDSYPNNSYSPYYGNNGIWFCGYQEQPVLLLDEFYGQVPLHKILQLLDPYPLRVETKGGTVPLHASIIFITSNATPDNWYPNDPLKKDRTKEIDALYRRIGYPNNHNYIDLSTPSSLMEDRLNLKNRLYFALADALPPPEHEGLKKLAAKALEPDEQLTSLPPPTITKDFSEPEVYNVSSDTEDESLFSWEKELFGYWEGNKKD